METDIESGQTIMKGMGELHLDILVDRLKREFKVEANIGAPQVAYRETIGREVEHTYTHKKQSGGSGQFAEVNLILISPTEPGEGYSFESKIVGGNVPKEYIPGVEKGIASVMDSGPLAGFPVIDFKVQLLDGKFHDVDSSVLAFEIAARMGMREGMRRAGAKLLEPIMKVEVICPEEYTGNVIGDLTSRRGQVTGPGEPRQRHRHRRDGAAGEHVRLHQHLAVNVLGPGELHDAVRPLRPGAVEHLRGDPGQVRLIGAAAPAAARHPPVSRARPARVDRRPRWPRQSSSATSRM